MLSAPTTRLLAVDHDQQGVDLVGFHQLRGLDGQCAGVDGARCARHHVGDRRAAQVDGGIVQACGAGRRR